MRDMHVAENMTMGYTRLASAAATTTFAALKCWTGVADPPVVSASLFSACLLLSAHLLSSVTFNYLGRDFYNAISEKNVDAFQLQLIKYLAGFCVGIPVYVFKAYYQVQAGLAVQSHCWLNLA